MPDIPAAAVVMGKKGRVGVALPFGALLSLAGAGAVVLISVIALIAYAISLIWIPFCALYLAGWIAWQIRRARKVHRD